MHRTTSPLWDGSPKRQRTVKSKPSSSLGACIALGCAGFIFTLVYWHALQDPEAATHRADLPGWVTRRILPAKHGRAAMEQYAVFRATQAHLLYNAVGITAIVLLAFGPWQQ